MLAFKRDNNHDLPFELPVPETDLCSILSNLFENAVEASLRTAPERRQVKASAHLHSEHMVLLSVENTYDGNIREKNDVLLSSKRPGEGIGLQAVQHTAEKNGGYCRFYYGDGVFVYCQCDAAGQDVILRNEERAREKAVGWNFVYTFCFYHFIIKNKGGKPFSETLNNLAKLNLLAKVRGFAKLYQSSYYQRYQKKPKREAHQSSR